jgi:hypothetical protein
VKLFLVRPQAGVRASRCMAEVVEPVQLAAGRFVDQHVTATTARPRHEWLDDSKRGGHRDRRVHRVAPIHQAAQAGQRGKAVSGSHDSAGANRRWTKRSPLGSDQPSVRGSSRNHAAICPELSVAIGVRAQICPTPSAVVAVKTRGVVC